MPTVRPDTSVMVKPSSKPLENAAAIAALPDRHSTPMPSWSPAHACAFSPVWRAHGMRTTYLGQLENQRCVL